MLYTNEQREAVKHAYLSRIPVPDIAREQGIAKRTLYYWIKTYEWDELPCLPNVEQVLDERIIELLNRKSISLDAIEMIERLQSAKARELKFKEIKTKLAKTHTDQDNENKRSSNKKEDKDQRETKKSKKTLAALTEEQILEAFQEDLFQYQTDLWESRQYRTRHILKSRQIGLTWYFAREAVTNALLTGENQIFLSASKNQSAIFNAYIKAFVQEKFNVELKGNEKIRLPTAKGEALLYFLSTNSSTAQGYSGHLYIDECFWINNFSKLQKVSSAIASHKHWRKTYFSTPSTKSHEAYALWSGSQYNEAAKQRGLPLLVMPDAATLSQGWVGPDQEYRKIITLEDAIDGGCTLFDIAQLEREYTPDDFAQLFMCVFIDDTKSVFNLEQLLACAVNDPRFMGFKPGTPRPFGNNPVWVGYDPSRTRDSSVISVIAPPSTVGSKYRVLELMTLHNMPWAQQAGVIKDITERYKVEHISIDKTGPGIGVYESVKDFFPSAQGLHYNPEIKTQLVLNALDVVTSQRIEWSSEHLSIPQSFLMIKKIVTDAGISYKASRDAINGHADAAWSIMHALFKDGLKIDKTHTSTYEFTGSP
jgi:uncharacterized protein YjcR